MDAAPPAVSGAPDVRVLSWNVNFGLSGDPDTVRVIREVDADLVLLQESDAGWEAAVRVGLSDVYPYMDFLEHGVAGGLAVLSRWDFHDVGVAPSPAGWFPAWVVRVATPAGPLQVVQVHLRPPVGEVGGFATGWIDSAPVHRREIEAAWAMVDPALPTLVAGDFNERSGGALRYLRGRGLRCGLHDRSPGALTWRWDVGWVTLRDALDHVLHDARLLPVGAEVLDAGSSDHLPIVAAYSMSGAER